jgi:hypothetical protein
VGDLLHLHRPGQVVIGVVEEDLVVGFQGGLPGDDDLAGVPVYLTSNNSDSLSRAGEISRGVAEVVEN